MTVSGRSRTCNSVSPQAAGELNLQRIKDGFISFSSGMRGEKSIRPLTRHYARTSEFRLSATTTDLVTGDGVPGEIRTPVIAVKERAIYLFFIVFFSATKVCLRSKKVCTVLINLLPSSCILHSGPLLRLLCFQSPPQAEVAASRCRVWQGQNASYVYIFIYRHIRILCRSHRHIKKKCRNLVLFSTGFLP